MGNGAGRYWGIPLSSAPDLAVRPCGSLSALGRQLLSLARLAQVSTEQHLGVEGGEGTWGQGWWQYGEVEEVLCGRTS